MNIALIFAGGVGSRMGLKIPKQFLEINGVPILVKTLQHFQNHKKIDAICLVIKEEYLEYTKKLVEDYHLDKVFDIIKGGSTGQDSIYNGLCHINNKFPSDSTILIHDGVRPIITSKVIDDNIESVKKYGSAITCKKCVETIITTKPEERVGNIIDRSMSLTAQAPQSFILKEILAAHSAVREINPNYEGVIDSCTLMRIFKRDLHIVMGNDDNLKVTTKKDYLITKILLEEESTELSDNLYSSYKKFWEGKSNE